MTNWYDDDDISGNFLSCREGTTLKVKVAEIKKIVGDKYSKFNYKKKDGSPVLTRETGEPFHHELVSADGRVLTVGALALIGALRNTKVVGGDEIEISHPGRGKYIIKKGTEAVELEDLESDDIPF